MTPISSSQPKNASQVMQELRMSKKGPSVEFVMQADGSYRAVKTNKPATSLSQVMSELRKDLKSPCREEPTSASALAPAQGARTPRDEDPMDIDTPPQTANFNTSPPRNQSSGTSPSKLKKFELDSGSGSRSRSGSGSGSGGTSSAERQSGISSLPKKPQVASSNQRDASLNSPSITSPKPKTATPGFTLPHGVRPVPSLGGPPGGWRGFGSDRREGTRWDDRRDSRQENGWEDRRDGRPDNRREEREDRRNERREKKKIVRTQHAQTASSSSSVAPPISAESSAAAGRSTEDKKFVANIGNPLWYPSVTSFELKQIAKKKPQEIAALEALKACITRCSETPTTKVLEELRNHIHKAEVLLKMDRAKARTTRILSAETGLPRVFDPKFPYDLRADAFQLYNRWWKGDFDTDLLRGIIMATGKEHNADRIDPKYRQQFPANSKEYGEGELVIGQWWPTQLCTVRDGAHGSAQGGIYGEKGKGTYSIVLSGGGNYNDVDEGDVIEYSGTDGKNAMPTENTQHMITSAILGNQIRVIRSAQLHKSNKYRPERGLRYDGLYVIKSYKEVDKEKAMYRFKLERCPGQPPIRCGNSNSRRPTIFEMNEYDKLKGKI